MNNISYNILFSEKIFEYLFIVYFENHIIECGIFCCLKKVVSHIYIIQYY